MENIKPNNDAILNGNTEKAVKPFSQTEKSFIREQFDEPDNRLLFVKVTFDIFKVILRKTLEKQSLQINSLSLKNNSAFCSALN